MSPIITLIILGVIIVAVFGGISFLSQMYNLDNIKSKTVGDGQHGTARWARKNEIKKYSIYVKIFFAEYFICKCKYYMLKYE